MRAVRTQASVWLIIGSVVSLVCLFQVLPRLLPVSQRPGESHFDAFRRIEWMTYDWRMRWARGAGANAASNLAAVFIDDEGLTKVNQELGYHWPWPRQLFGRALRELTAQKASAVACDVFFLESQADYTETRVALPDGRRLSSDAFFAEQLRAAGNVILGAPGQMHLGRWTVVEPLPLFRTNAAGLGLAATDRDSDGVLRRARPFRDDHRLGRLWHLGLRLAAAHLGLDLTNAVVLDHRIELRGPAGQSRVIPLDDDGYFLIDWSLDWNDRRIALASLAELLEFDGYRQAGETNLEAALENRLVVIGSIGSGNNISDVGATPVAKETYLVSKHWNVANSLLQDRFIRPPRFWEETALIILLGCGAGWITWRLRVLWASFWVAMMIAAYVGTAVWAFVHHRFWLPLALPICGALVMTHVSVVTWRVVVEQHERRRVKAIFSRIVAPDVVNELLRKERLEFGGAQRDITVLFADIRGFTKLTDDNQRWTDDYIARHGFTGAEREAVLAENARQTLATVNAYLAVIADNVKKHHGTLDKYIGDCVMAFWGAPVPNPRHAVAAVQAAIDSQRAIAELNRRRASLASSERGHEVSGLFAGRPVGLLALGTGINTGLVTVGLMGSEAHILSYTVFGREVNLASRLETVSGHERIIISAATHEALLQGAPDLAHRCQSLPAVSVKGIAQPVPIYEVPWRDAGVEAGEVETRPEQPRS